MGLYRKHRSVTEHRTEVSPIGYEALTLVIGEFVDGIDERGVQF